MMVISLSKKTIFLHPGKTGGATIRKAIKRAWNGTGDYGYPWRHCRATDARRVLGDTIWKNKEFFKFATVRNPFIRLVSWYQHIIRNHEKKIAGLKRKIAMDGHNKEDEDKIKEFEDEMKWTLNINHFSDKIDYWQSEQYFEKVSRQQRGQDRVLENVVDWLDDGDGLSVDFFIRCENIQEDWLKVCEILKIDANYLYNKNIGKMGNSVDIYKQFYTAELIKKVKKIFEKDLDYFGYTYDTIA